MSVGSCPRWLKGRGCAGPRQNGQQPHGEAGGNALFEGGLETEETGWQGLRRDQTLSVLGGAGTFGRGGEGQWPGTGSQVAGPLSGRRFTYGSVEGS